MPSVDAAASRPAQNTLPAAELRAYNWCVVQDHLLRRATLVSQPGVSSTMHADLLARLRQEAPRRGADFRLEGDFTANITAADYRSAFDRIQAYIQAGDCYQVNLAQRFTSKFSGDPWHAYRELRAVAAAPFSAYLMLADGNAVISLSPERFLSLHGHHVETAPIKGTRAPPS